MDTFIQAKVDPEAIITAMNEDSGFAKSLWFELAHKLRMGLLLDNACDVFATDLAETQYVANQFEHFAKMLRSQHDELSQQ